MRASQKQELRQRADATKRGSITRQVLISVNAMDALADIENCELNGSAQFRAFMDTWVKPSLREIIRAADGGHL